MDDAAPLSLSFLGWRCEKPNTVELDPKRSPELGARSSVLKKRLDIVNVDVKKYCFNGQGGYGNKDDYGPIDAAIKPSLPHCRFRYTGKRLAGLREENSCG